MTNFSKQKKISSVKNKFKIYQVLIGNIECFNASKNILEEMITRDAIKGISVENNDEQISVHVPDNLDTHVADDEDNINTSTGTNTVQLS